MGNVGRKVIDGMIFAGNPIKRTDDMGLGGVRVTWLRSSGMSLIAMDKRLGV